MVVKPKELFSRENMELAASGMISGGSALLTYVMLEGVIAGAQVAVTSDPEVKRKREKNIIKAAWKSVKDTWEEIKSRPWEAPLLVTPYYHYETARHMWQYLTSQSGPLDTAQKATLALLTKVIKLHAYFIVGACMFAAGWSLWLTFHPEVLSAAITAIGNVSEQAIDEISQIIEGSYSWVPDELSVVG